MTRTNPMKRSFAQKLAAAAAIAVVITGGAVAAVSATGQSNKHAGAKSRPHAHSALRAAAHHRHMGLAVATAAGYLGLTGAQLQSELRGGRSLAQIASASHGKSTAGLIDALVAAKRARLAKLSATLTQRVTAEVNRGGGSSLRGRAAHARRSGGKRRHRHGTAARS